MSDHYFTTPQGPDVRREVVLRAWDHELSMHTGSGVFSSAGLDRGTDVLLRHRPRPTGGGTLLDLGCGWGPVACALAAADPAATVWAVDVNERAVELADANAQRHGLRVRARHPEQVPTDLTFDALWSNPPVRIGKAALHELLLTWLPRLAAGGQAHLVVGRHLGADSLQRWLEAQGWPTARVASEKGFRVLEAARA